MRATTSLIFTPTGQSTTQPGLAHSMQREASVRASAVCRPRFTSEKLRLRARGSASGMWRRRIFMRSLRGRMLNAERGRTLLSGIMGLPSGQFFAKLGHLLVPAFIEALDGLALVVAVHGVALHEYLEVDLGSVELGTIDAGELALVAEQHAATAAHAGAVNHDGVEADHGLDAQRRRHVR